MGIKGRPGCPQSKLTIRQISLIGISFVMSLTGCVELKFLNDAERQN
jgi:hypothetical protein